MVWVVLAILLIVIFGLGTVLEAAFWMLVVLAAVAIVASLAVARAISR